MLPKCWGCFLKWNSLNFYLPFLLLTFEFVMIQVKCWPVMTNRDKERMSCGFVSVRADRKDAGLVFGNNSCNTKKSKPLEIDASITKNVVDLLRSEFSECGLNKASFRFKINQGCDLYFCGDRDSASVGNLTKDGNNCVNVEDLTKSGYAGGDGTEIKMPDFKEYPKGTCTCKKSIFNPQWTGIIYSAYDKYPERCATGNSNDLCHVTWWNYTEDDISLQLDLISSTFKQVSLYGMGTVESEDSTDVHDWKDGALDSALSPLRIAEMNNRSGYHRLQVLVAAFRQPDYRRGWVDLEVKRAIDATLESNQVFPQTVWGICTQVNVGLELDTGFEYAIEILHRMRNRTSNSRVNTTTGQDGGVQVGVRITDCDKAILESNRSEDKARLYCRPNDNNCKSETLNPILINLALKSEFVLCVLKPELPDPWRNIIEMKRIVEEVGAKFLAIKSAFKKVNQNITLIGETGWPSRGYSDNRSPNNLKNQRNYWMYMSSFAEREGFPVYLFEAFDEPWKNKLGAEGQNKKSSDGVCGSEAFYGFWKRVNNSDPAVYIDKFSEVNGTFNLDSENFLEKAEIRPECVIDSTLPQSYSTPKSNLTWIIIGSLLGVSAVFLVIVSYMGYRLRRANNSEAVISQRYLEMFLQGLPADAIKKDGDLDYQVIALQFPYDKKKYELPADRFQIDTGSTIGKGQSGTVYRGKIQGFIGDIAFKSTGAHSSIMDIKNLLSEIKIMSYIGKHENVICLLGAYTEKLEKGIVCVALEYCALGSLDKFLEKYRNNFQPSSPVVEPIMQTNYTSVQTCNCDVGNYVTTNTLMNEPIMFKSEGLKQKDMEFDESVLLQWARELANGMEFLAQKKVVHADLATRNVLLTETRNVKITDFGLSRKLYHELGETFDPEQPLPWRWMAPQSLRHLTFSTESDVWSYGITLWEIFSLGEVPYSAVTFSHEFVIDLENGYRMESPRYASSELHDLILKCWKFHPEERPSFTQLKQAISSLQSSNVLFNTFNCDS